MTRTARPPRRQVVAAVLGLLLLAALVVVSPAETTPGMRLFFGLFALLILGLGLGVLVNRARVSEAGVALRALLPRRRLKAPLEELVLYAPDKEGVWWVETADRRAPVSVAEPWEFHAGIAALAPAALNAKRLRPKYAPPEEEFRALWTYDVEELLSQIVGRVVAVVALVLLTRQTGAAYGLLLAPLFFGVFEMFGRIDVTNEGVVRRGPFHRRTIPWADAVAVFCERTPLRRSFVLTSRDAAIEIPHHLARDLDLMRKVFRSLPEGTLCVNFDETTFRGYRRRKKAPEEALPQDDLLPALTASSSFGPPRR